MYVSKNSLDINVLLHRGNLEKLAAGEKIKREMRDQNGKPLSMYATVELGETKRPNMDIELGENIKITVNKDYGYNVLDGSGIMPVLCGSFGDGRVAIGNKYWEEEKQ
jgi:predicted ArsR family transcriptional regulator